MTARLNRFADRCAKCRVDVAAEAGSLIGPPWQVVCTACLPRPVAATSGLRIRVELVGDELALTPATFLGGDRFAAYRSACDGSRFDRGSKANMVSLATAPRVLDRLRGAGFELDVSVEAASALAGLAERAATERAAAASRVAQVDAILAERGCSLYSFQRTGVDWLASRSSALLADDMGLGKTVQALTAIPEGSAVLVVCPAVAKGVWVREAARWRPDLRPVALRGRGSFRWPVRGEMVVVNYDILPGETGGRGPAELADGLAQAPAQCVLVFDECHAAKNSKAQRTKRAKALRAAVVEAGGRVYGLTATPLLNRPPELWSVLSVLGLERETFGSYMAFERLLGAIKTRWGTDWDPARIDMAAVQERLRRVMLRRMKREVLSDLPPKRRERLLVNGLDAATRKACDAALAALAERGVSLEQAAARAAETAGGVAFTEMSAARAALATAKLASAIELAESCEDAGEPVVVFSAHRAPVDALGGRPGWATITGETPAEERSRIEARFQAGELRGVAATIKAGGVAITLTRAARAIFIDQDWTPALNDQAEDRVYRIGQDRAVLVTILVAEHALDERIADLLASKRETLAATIDAAVRAGTEDVGAEEAARLDAIAAEAAASAADLLARAERERAAADAFAAEVARIEAELIEEQLKRRSRSRGNSGMTPDQAAEWARTEARARARRRRVDVTEEELEADPRGPQTERERWAAEALETLAACDPDRARDMNGVGFSKSDAGTGHMLARRALAGLTPAEWKLAAAVCCRYWRQVGRMPSTEQ